MRRLALLVLVVVFVTSLSSRAEEAKGAGGGATAERDRRAEAAKAEPSESGVVEPGRGTAPQEPTGPQRDACGTAGEDRTGEAAGKGAWMGIQVAPVPPALASHVGLRQGEGLMVVNVVVDSPADEAGLKQYDVVISFGKSDVTDELAFVETVRSHRPGDEVRLQVIRRGKIRRVGMTLGEPMPPGGIVYKYRQAPPALLRDQTVWKLHKGMWQGGPQGWTFVGPQGKLELPRDMMERLQKGLRSELWVGALPGGASFKIVRSRNGKTIEVFNDEHGHIVVVRRKGGEPGRGQIESKKTFPSAAELKAKDPEAYALYEDITSGKGTKGAGRRGMGSVSEQIRREIEAAFAGPGANGTDLRKALEKQIRDLVRRQEAAGDDDAAREFNVDEKGRITVRVRKGADELVMTFESEKAFAEKRPKLHEHYRKLLEDPQ
jgi:hypothetical protein